uniref:Uncharacterized protein n=1 Tax=viral metagenome TaxID=1070528 RepID=A0A2V0R9N1_9ZZZZ
MAHPFPAKNEMTITYVDPGNANRVIIETVSGKKAAEITRILRQVEDQEVDASKKAQAPVAAPVDYTELETKLAEGVTIVQGRLVRDGLYARATKVDDQWRLESTQMRKAATRWRGHFLTRLLTGAIACDGWVNVDDGPVMDMYRLGKGTSPGPGASVLTRPSWAPEPMPTRVITNAVTQLGNDIRATDRTTVQTPVQVSNREEVSDVKARRVGDEIQAVDSETPSTKRPSRAAPPPPSAVSNRDSNDDQPPEFDHIKDDWADQEEARNIYLLAPGLPALKQFCKEHDLVYDSKDRCVRWKSDRVRAYLETKDEDCFVVTRTDTGVPFGFCTTTLAIDLGD